MALTTSLEINDLRAAQKWSREQTQLWIEKRREERVVNLKWVLTHPWSCIVSALYPPSAENDNSVSESLKSDESVQDCCEGQTFESPCGL